MGIDQALEGLESQRERQKTMDHLSSVQELEAQQQQYAALFYQMHHQEAAERLKRQALREELAQVLLAMREAQAATPARSASNVLAALSVRAATLHHEIAASSEQIAALTDQEELAECCYEETLQQLEALLGRTGSNHRQED